MPPEAPRQPIILTSLCACDGLTGIRRPGARFDAASQPGGENRLAAVRGSNLTVKWNFSKKIIENNVLRRKVDHICVLFVQHRSEKGRSEPVRSGSFVACAGVLGNCDLATEGGIPRSSR